MRPGLLPPLIIPKRHSKEPVLLASYSQKPPEQPVPRYRPSYQYLAHKPLPKIRPEPRLDDFDDIDVFNFYHPCLLPPSPIRPANARPNRDPGVVELPIYTREGPLYPGPGLRRSTNTVSKRDQSYRRHTHHVTVAPPSRSRSPSPLRPSPEPPSSPTPRPPVPTAQLWPSPESPRGPSPAPEQAPHPSPSPESPLPPTLAHLAVEAPPPLRVRLPQWDTSSSIYSIHSDVSSLRSIAEDQDTSAEEPEKEECLTPYLAFRSDSGYQSSFDGYHDREQTALRELWGVIDGLLGPGTNRLGDYDTRSIASSMEGLRTVVGEWNGSAKRGSGQNGQAVPQNGPWWRGFRQGLMLS